jgi:hypothetical protein
MRAIGPMPAFATHQESGAVHFIISYYFFPGRMLSFPIGCLWEKSGDRPPSGLLAAGGLIQGLNQT